MTTRIQSCATHWLVVLALSGVTPLLASAETSRWGAYLRSPNPETYRLLADELRSCHDAECSKEVRPSSSDVAQLLRIVDRGDRWATDIAFLSIHLLDGGDLEDVMRSVSSLSEHHPSLLLQMIEEHQLSDAQIERLLRMLPLHSVDDQGEKRRIVERRIKSLSTVSDPKLTRVRNLSIASLKRLLSELKGAPSGQ